jgi:hypothetical protein
MKTPSTNIHNGYLNVHVREPKHGKLHKCRNKLTSSTPLKNKNKYTCDTYNTSKNDKLPDPR